MRQDISKSNTNRSIAPLEGEDYDLFDISIDELESIELEIARDSEDFGEFNVLLTDPVESQSLTDRVMARVKKSINESQVISNEQIISSNTSYVAPYVSEVRDTSLSTWNRGALHTLISCCRELVESFLRSRYKRWNRFELFSSYSKEDYPCHQYLSEYEIHSRLEKAYIPLEYLLDSLIDERQRSNREHVVHCINVVLQDHGHYLSNRSRSSFRALCSDIDKGMPLVQRNFVPENKSLQQDYVSMSHKVKADIESSGKGDLIRRIMERDKDKTVATA